MKNLAIHEFRPLRFTLDRVGPFQRRPYEIDFTDAEDRPCNIFLLMSENGRGKSTVLACMALLMRHLGASTPTPFGHEDIDYGKGRLQLDVLVRLHWQGRDRRIVLSLVVGQLGEQVFLKRWDARELRRYGADGWHQSGFHMTGAGRPLLVGPDDELVADLRFVCAAEGKATPESFANAASDLPTSLYFPACRDILPIQGIADRPITEPEHWGYQTSHEFSADGTHWTASLDGLLVWLAWLNNGSFEAAVDAVNETVFKETPDKFLERAIRRVPPEAVVNSGGQRHRLDRLSSGEKNLAQLFLRIGAHSTRNTWILVDELDVHLHVRWQHRALNLMKAQVRRQPGTTVIAATHSVEMLQAFPVDIQEEGLIKGGWIIEENLR